MLFRDYHVPLIESGEKVQTRRIVNLKRSDLNPWKVGSIHKIMTKYHKDGFRGYVLITGVRQQVLADITFRDAVREGYESIDSYWEAFKKIYGNSDPELLVWVILFILGKRKKIFANPVLLGVKPIKRNWLSELNINCYEEKEADELLAKQDG